MLFFQVSSSNKNKSSVVPYKQIVKNNLAICLYRTTEDLFFYDIKLEYVMNFHFDEL